MEKEVEDTQQILPAVEMVRETEIQHLRNGFGSGFGSGLGSGLGSGNPKFDIDIDPSSTAWAKVDKKCWGRVVGAISVVTVMGAIGAF